MTNSRMLILFCLIIILGCGNENGIEKRIVHDVTRFNRFSFKGLRGEKVHFKINGRFSGSIKFAMIGSSNKLTEKDFSIYRDSINLDIGILNIYEDHTGFTWYVRPVNATNGKVLISITEYRE